MSNPMIVQKLLHELFLSDAVYEASRNINLVDDHQDITRRSQQMFKHREDYANDDLTDDEENKEKRQQTMYRATSRRDLLTKRDPLKRSGDFAGCDAEGMELSHTRKKARIEGSQMEVLQLGLDAAEYARAIVDQRSGALMFARRESDDMSMRKIQDIVRTPTPSQLPWERSYAEQYCLRTPNDDGEPACINQTQCVGNLLMNKQAAPCTLVALILRHERTDPLDVIRARKRQCLLCYRNLAQCFWTKYLFSAECAPPNQKLPPTKRFLPFYEKVDQDGEYSVLQAITDTRERVFGFTRPIMEFTLSHYNVEIDANDNTKKVVTQHLLQYPVNLLAGESVF